MDAWLQSYEQFISTENSIKQKNFISFFADISKSPWSYNKYHFKVQFKCENKMHDTFNVLHWSNFTFEVPWSPKFIQRELGKSSEWKMIDLKSTEICSNSIEKFIAPCSICTEFRNQLQCWFKTRVWHVDNVWAKYTMQIWLGLHRIVSLKTKMALKYQFKFVVPIGVAKSISYKITSFNHQAYEG